ncbi:hypothetical protein [Merdimonas faecis]
MEIVLGLSRSESDIEEIRKRICYILLAVLLIMNLAFTAERFENAVPVKAKDSWNVQARADVLPDVTGNSLAIEAVLATVYLAKTLNLQEENLLVKAGSMTAEPAVMPALAETSSAEAVPAVTAPTATAPTVTIPEAMVPDVTTPTEDITTPGATDTPGTTDTPGAAVVPEILTIHLNGNGGEPALSTMTESMDAISAEGWSVPFRPGKVFDGWYLDAGCTVPFTGVNPENYSGADTAVLEVYAGWRELDGFVCNDAGHIISCAGGSVIDGIFALPSDAACTGIEAGALSSVAGLITEVYIPANITYIGPGAFNGLTNLMYIEATPGNPNYYSAGGVLYTMSGEVVAAPVWYGECI